MSCAPCYDPNLTVPRSTGGVYVRIPEFWAHCPGTKEGGKGCEPQQIAAQIARTGGRFVDFVVFCDCSAGVGNRRGWEHHGIEPASCPPYFKDLFGVTPWEAGVKHQDGRRELPTVWRRTCQNCMDAAPKLIAALKRAKKGALETKPA